MMRRWLESVLLSGVVITVGFSASLEIYQDGVRYRYVPVDRYVGFIAPSSTARCGDRELGLEVRGECPESKRLCRERKRVEDLASEYRAVQESLAALKSWIRSTKPGEPDAARWISASEKIGGKRAEWLERAGKLKGELEEARRRFAGQVAAPNPRYTRRLCKEELELTLPAGGIEVGLQNVGELEEKRIKVYQYLTLRNRSGVEISAKDGRIYARKIRPPLRPVPFDPWVVRPWEERRNAGGSAPLKREERLRYATTGSEAPPPPEAPVAKRLGYRDYAFGEVELPSTGEEVRILLASFESPLRCEERTYPWRDPGVYRVCRFKPARALESDRWLLKRGRKILSEKSFGTYEEGRYLLVVGRDTGVEVRRRELVEKERSSGIFGGKIRRKDGFRLRITNRTDRQKTLKIIERIPRSTTEKISVKLLEVQGAVRESFDEESGRLVMQAVLAPREVKEVKVLFELIYEKGMKVRY
jgi:hypothetical protein